MIVYRITNNHIQSSETRLKMSLAKKGKPSWIKGKTFKIINGKRVYGEPLT